MNPLLRRLVPFLLTSPAALAQCALEWQTGEPLPQMRGPVQATQVFDPDGAGPSPSLLVACGDLDAGNFADRSLLAWNGTEWVELPGSPQGDFRAMCVWNGQLVVAGDAIWTWDGATWTARGTPGSGTVHAVAASGTQLVAVGTFTWIDGWATNRVAAWTGNGWTGLGAGLSGTPKCAAFYDNQLYVGGDLVPGGGSMLAHLQRWNGTTWTPVGLWDGPIETLAVRLSTSPVTSYLFAGGAFSVINGILIAPRVARYNAPSNSWVAQGRLDLDSGATACTRLFVRNVGISSFQVAAGVAGAAPSLVWTLSGSTWTSLGSVPTGAATIAPSTLAYYGGRYHVGVAAQAAITPSSLYELDSYWRSVRRYGISGTIAAVGAYGDDMVVSGQLTSIGGLGPLNGIARGRPGAWNLMGAGLGGGPAYAFATLPNGDLVAAGAFTSAGGVPASHIARWDGANWHPLGAGVGGLVSALAVLPNGDLVAAGSFLSAGGQPASRVARWDGAAWHALGSGVDDELTCAAVLPNGDLVVGGQLTTAGGVSASRIARWDGSAWHALGAGTNGDVYDLAVAPDGALWVAGSFRFAGGSPIARLAIWNGGTWLAPALPPAGVWSQTLLVVDALPDGSIVTGGYLQATGAPPATSALWRLTSSGWSDLEVDGTVLRTALGPHGELYCAGSFLGVGDTAADQVAELRPTCPGSAANFGAGCVGSGGLAELRATTVPWDGQLLRTRATGLPALSFALVVYGLLPIGVPLPLLLPEGQPGCSLFASPDILGLALPNGGALDCELLLAPTPSLVGTTFYHQVVPFEVGVAGVVAVTATNGLALSVGSYD